jgi:hypothetical protein
MYKLYRVGDRTEPCGTPAYIDLGVDISPSTETLNFLCERNYSISLIKLVENCNLDKLSKNKKRKAKNWSWVPDGCLTQI